MSFYERIRVLPTDRLHWMVWRSPTGERKRWRAARAMNGAAIEFAAHFDTQPEALTHTLTTDY